MQSVFSYPITADELSGSEKKYKIKANKEELQYLQEIFKVEEVRSFNAEINLKYKKKEHRIDVWGQVIAEFELKSVISLENFEKTYSPEFSIYFDTQATPQDIKDIDFDIYDEEPYLLTDGKLDLCQIAIEQVALVMDDNPRQAGEEFHFVSEFDEETNEALNPFNILKKLKK